MHVQCIRFAKFGKFCVLDLLLICGPAVNILLENFAEGLVCMIEIYDPGLPKEMKWNKIAVDGTGAVAANVLTFVDKGRILGFLKDSKENYHEVHGRFASQIQYLGMQKVRPPSGTKTGAQTDIIFRVVT